MITPQTLHPEYNPLYLFAFVFRLGSDDKHAGGEWEAERGENVQGVHGCWSHHCVPAMRTLCLLRWMCSAAAEMSHLPHLRQRHCQSFYFLNSLPVYITFQQVLFSIVISELPVLVARRTQFWNNVPLPFNWCCFYSVYRLYVWHSNHLMLVFVYC